MYVCKQCGAEAFCDDFVIRRTCEHTGTVIATMSATAYGKGHVEQSSRLSQIVDAIISLVKRT